METIYSTAKVCRYKDIERCDVSLQPGKSVLIR